MGPASPGARTLSAEEEGTCIGFRIHTMLPLDDSLYALQLMMPQLSRSGLHRLYQRHNISRLADIPGKVSDGNQKADNREIGGFYIDAADIRTGDGKATMLFAFDRTSKLAFAKLYEEAGLGTGGSFLDTLVSAVPYRVSTVLSGENPMFLDRNQGPNPDHHPFQNACLKHEINHHPLPFDQPWRIRRSPKEAENARIPDGRGFRYESHAHLETHFHTFLKTYNFERRLKTLGGLTPYEFVCRYWQNDPGRFLFNPILSRPNLIL